jgi:hypothetical protein
VPERSPLALSSSGMETPESSEGLVCHEVLEGTPAFMAPELCSCTLPYPFAHV